MDCDKGAVEKMRKVNTRTSLFLCRLLAQQLNPKSQLPPEFLALLFFFLASGRRWRGSGRQEKKRQRGRKRRTATHVSGCAHAHTHTHSHILTLTLKQQWQ